jgi:hypothetical protein
MTDDELRSILRTWHAPAAPGTLYGRVFHARGSWGRWLLSGEIRLPVPVALVLLALLLLIAWRELRPPQNSLSNFEQVHKFQPRIVRTIHETR